MASVDHQEDAALREAAWREIEEMRREIEASRGWHLRAALASLARSRRIFEGNHQELHELLTHSRSPEVWLTAFDPENPERLEELLDETDRLFHNFLASAYSFVSHTIAFRNRHVPDGSGLAEEYDHKNPTPRSPLCLFMKRLRVVTQHERLPITRGNVRAWRDGTGQLVVEPLLVVERAHLLTRHKWTGEARRYLETLDDDPVLDDLAMGYAVTLGGFADWFAFQFVQEHLPEFRELEDLYQRLGPAAKHFTEPRT